MDRRSVVGWCVACLLAGMYLGGVVFGELEDFTALPEDAYDRGYVDGWDAGYNTGVGQAFVGAGWVVVILGLVLLVGGVLWLVWKVGRWRADRRRTG